MMNNEHLEEVACNLCGSTDFAVKYLPTNTDYDPTKIFSASGGIMGTQQIVRCRSCGLIYVNPRVKQETVSEAYSEAVDELYISQETGRIQTFEKCLRIVEEYAPQKGKILDVGCAAGFFLHTAKQHGWEPYGVEPSRWMAEWGNERFGLSILPGFLKEAKYENNQFDAVTMWDVLEHTPDPMSELAETNRILKPGGILVINFPNIGSKLARLAGRRWWFILSVHLYHFTPQTITRMLELNGFEVLSIRRHYQTLNLEHLMKMVGLYSPGLSNFGLRFIRALRMQNWQIPYYASQANVAARKK